MTSAMAGSSGGAAEPKPLSAQRMLRLIAANASVLTAALVYMGWAYQNAEYGHFGLNPQELNVGILEYMLYSLDSFSQVLVIAAVVVVAAGTVLAAVPDLRAWQRSRPRSSTPTAGKPEPEDHPQEGERGAGEQDSAAPGAVTGAAPQRWPAVFAFVITAVFAALWAVGFRFTGGSYVYLAVFGVGPLLFTRAYRDREQGRFAYATAIVLAAVCAMYAGALYAQAKGSQEAQTIAHGGGSMPHVTVYSEQPLGLSGHGIQAQPLLPGAGYHWRYEGLRLLTVRSGSYYLFPARPTSGPEPTYVLDDSDGIRVVLGG